MFHLQEEFGALEVEEGEGTPPKKTPRIPNHSSQSDNICTHCNLALKRGPTCQRVGLCSGTHNFSHLYLVSRGFSATDKISVSYPVSDAIIMAPSFSNVHEKSSHCLQAKNIAQFILFTPSYPGIWKTISNLLTIQPVLITLKFNQQLPLE